MEAASVVECASHAEGAAELCEFAGGQRFADVAEAAGISGREVPVDDGQGEEPGVGLVAECFEVAAAGVEDVGPAVDDGDAGRAFDVFGDAGDVVEVFLEEGGGTAGDGAALGLGVRGGAFVGHGLLQIP
jgi:hypothetical protein